jgi:lambda family phage portal protein
MSALSKLSGAIDSAIAVVSPQKAIRRNYHREILSKISKQKKRETYAAAKTSRVTGTWSPADINVNDLIRASNPKIRARVRQLVRDFPIFTRAVTVVLDNVVGAGIKFQSHALTASGKFDNTAILKIEDAWKRWGDEADISGKQSIYQLMRSAKRQELESGEFLLVRRIINDKARYLPFCLQAVEADWLTDNSTVAIGKGNEIEQGIEYNKITGQAVWFHFTDPDSWGKSIRVPAADVVHGFEFLRPGQMHGVSPFVSGVLVARDLGEYMDAEIDTAKMAAKYLAFVTKDPATRGSLLEDGEGDDEGKKIDEMENALIEYLSPGENITIASNPRPGGNFPPTVKLILCMLSAATGVPYELLSFDYSGINYSSTRVIRNDFIHQLKPVIDRHVRQFCNPVATSFLDAAVLYGGVSLPKYRLNKQRYAQFSWQPPGAEMIDWLKESKARINEMGVSLRSPQEIVLARGRDYEEVLKETKLAYDKIKEMGLDFLLPIIWKQSSTSVANNPAAVDGQDNGNGKGRMAEIAGLGLPEDVLIMLEDMADNIESLTGET